MSDYDSNYDYIKCPHCDMNITSYQEYDHDIGDLEDEDEDFFQCVECENFFKIELYIHKEYEYIVSKPTKEEMKEYNFKFIKDEDIVEDVPGQMFMWDDL